MNEYKLVQKLLNKNITIKANSPNIAGKEFMKKIYQKLKKENKLSEKYLNDYIFQIQHINLKNNKKNNKIYTYSANVFEKNKKQIIKLNKINSHPKNSPSSFDDLIKDFTTI